MRYPAACFASSVWIFYRSKDARRHFRDRVLQKSSLRRLEGGAVTWAISEAGEFADWKGERGYVHEGGRPRCGRPFCAPGLWGPPAMIDAMVRLLLKSRVKRSQIRFDKFSLILTDQMMGQAYGTGQQGPGKGALMKSLDNALTLLEQFTPRRRHSGITELATRLGLNKATVFNMLKTLEAHSLVRAAFRHQEIYPWSRHHRACGHKLAQSELSHVARPHLARLSHETNETTHLAILHRNELLYLEKIESSQPVRAARMEEGRRCIARQTEGPARLSA